MLRIAVPIIMADVGWMMMGLVDTIMVGSLGPEAVSAAGVSTSMQMGFAVFGMGTLLGLDALVSKAYGAKDLENCRQWLSAGITLAACLAVPIMATSLLVSWVIPSMGFHPAVTPMLQSYFSIVIWSTPFLLGYAALRRYLHGMHIVKPVMLALVSANLINVAGNWLLIHGLYGFPRSGVTGSAWATLISRIYMLGVLIVAVWLANRAHRDKVVRGAPLRIDRARLRGLLKLGFPAASQVLAEVGVFALVSVFAGMLDPVSSASHQIAMNLVGVAFMVPLGMGSAGAVKMGHAIGAGVATRASASGWTAIALGVSFMTASSLLFFLAPEFLIGLFTRDAAVLSVGSSLLRLAAVFQFFDGIQGVTTGTLRALGDTRTPMAVNLAAHWLLGVPVSYTLCFVLGWGVWGLWVGLSTGLIITGVILLYVWMARIRQYLAGQRVLPNQSH